MPTIYVDEMRCQESSDASDDIYMMVFRGNTTAPYDSNVAVKGPGNFWDDFDAGEVWKQDIPIAMYRPDSVYVVMLIEQDSGRDIDDTALGLWKTLTSVAWRAVMVSQLAAGLPSGQEAQMQASAQAIINAFLGAADATLRAPKDPDDIIGSPTRLVVTPGKTTTLEFKEKNGSGRYKVIFKVK